MGVGARKIHRGHNIPQVSYTSGGAELGAGLVIWCHFKIARPPYEGNVAQRLASAPPGWCLVGSNICLRPFRSLMTSCVTPGIGILLYYMLFLNKYSSDRNIIWFITYCKPILLSENFHFTSGKICWDWKLCNWR